MTANLEALRPHLKKFEFKQLFNRLGWDHYQLNPISIAIGETAYTLEAVAQKRGMAVFVCQPGRDGAIPDSFTRRRIDKETAKLAHEHLLIFVDAARTTQVWQWIRRGNLGEPSRLRTHTYHKHQPGDSLLQKIEGMRFTFAEEEGLTQPEVPARVRKALDIERVTKRFYDKFEGEHEAFLGFIEGISEQGDREWYASVMLNRLMFVYFIQKQGFLDNDKNYLRKRLELVRKKKGDDQFHSFYRQFLLKLFHDGFSRPTPRGKELDALLGKIPYLNGGIFDLHELEQNYKDKIHITDAAFERIFTFFESYEWHLEAKPPEYYVLHPEAGEEINPDVLGYIFEKYINNKQMGAYYTKEDITEYIAKNTILPFLFDKAAPACSDAFRADGPLWQLLRADPDRYLYEPVRRGVDVPLPKEIAAGVDDVSQRQNWNRPAAAEVALPTESWREHVARRRRCLDLRKKLSAGEIHAVNDLITWNLDIRRFAEDVIDTCEDPALLLAIWQALKTVSVLDPTCGSGAFLFAALNILQPLYDAALDRMQDLLDSHAAAAGNERPLEQFRQVLKQVQSPLHPNRSYFVLKSIVVNNLYGVDIMKEAVEICKLRLFLKLIAQIHQVEHLEPLPDIDFNIRPGNTLVGFAIPADVHKTILGTLADDDHKRQVAAIDQEAATVDRAYQMFHDVQTAFSLPGSALAEKKQELRERLDVLNKKLHRYLAEEYGIDPDEPSEFAEWQSSHKPFHWYAEFYGIMKRGGFDVIIGNPPYVEYKNVVAKSKYRLLDQYKPYRTNLYAACCFQSIQLKSGAGRSSFIVPISLPSTDRMEPLRLQLANAHSIHHASFSNRPSKLFEGAEQRLTVYLHYPAKEPRTYSAGYLKWYGAERAQLFDCVEYVEAEPIRSRRNIWPKPRASVENGILRKVRTFTELGRYVSILAAAIRTAKWGRGDLTRTV